MGVWVGYDDNRSLGLSGGVAAVPIVGAFLTGADLPLDEQFDRPDGIEDAYTSSGDWRWCGEREYFLAGTAPPSTACAFRRMSSGGGAHETSWREVGDQLQRIILDRILAEIETRRQRR